MFRNGLAPRLVMASVGPGKVIGYSASWQARGDGFARQLGGTPSLK